MASECPVCGKSAYRVDDDSVVGEKILKYRHSPHQFPNCEILTCTDVETIPYDQVLTNECLGPGCSEEISPEEGFCSKECSKGGVE